MKWRGEGGQGRVGAGRGLPVSEMVSAPYTNSVCDGVEVSCKQN